MGNSQVRVRFAPSPTGHLHVGGARAYLFNWLYARHVNGKVILRIDDTDAARSRVEYEQEILSSLARLGLPYDETPIRQSDRMSRYAEVARTLLDSGKAYPCFCSPQEIEVKRDLALKMGRPAIYDGTCARLSTSEVVERIARGMRPSLRFRAPMGSEIAFTDSVRGEMKFPAGSIGDFLISRSQAPGEAVDPSLGMPVYNFSCTIDDHDMGITHVIRGEDHLSNAPRQVMIYQALGWSVPIFAHTAMVLGTDRQKLSKRNGDSSLADVLAGGILPETLINFLSFLGWSPPEGLTPQSGHPEILTVEELIAAFSLERLQKSAAVFDPVKLAWMNSFYLRTLPLERILESVKPYLSPEFCTWLESARGVLGENAYENAVGLLRGESAALPALAASVVTLLQSHGASIDAQSVPAVRAFESAVSSHGTDKGWDGQLISRLLSEASQASGLKGKAFFQPVRLALTSQAHGPELKRVIVLFSRGEIMRRLKEALG